MIYAYIRARQKSHCDYPSPWFEEYVVAKDKEELDKIVKRVTKGCEDYDVTEISKERYVRVMEYEKELYS